MTQRTNPFEVLERTFERMSHQFEDAARSWESGEGRDRWFPSGGPEPMALDVADRETEFVVTVDVPGFERDDIDVRVRDSTLSIDAERDVETEATDETYLRREREHRTLSRSITLPVAVDADAVTATLKNGVMTITVPKTESDEESHQVEIQVE